MFLYLSYFHVARLIMCEVVIVVCCLECELFNNIKSQ